MKWEELDGTIPDCTLGRWMDVVEEETSEFPNWTDEVPEWVKKLV
jgi:hypothetical protein